MENNKLELYIHIPFCVKKCNYCDFTSFSGCEDSFDAYVEALCKEIQSKKEEYSKYQISTIYMGGGTPTILSKAQTEKIVDCLNKNFNISNTKEKRKGLFLQKKIRPTTEFSIECNPGTIDREKLKTYKRIGINRISFGLQSTIEEELKVLGRIHTYKQFDEGFEIAREEGFDNINVDLMQAVPGQTMRSWQISLGQIALWHPEHISAYSLIIEDGTNFQKWLKKGKTISGEDQNGIITPEGNVLLLPSESQEREIYYFTKELLEKSGYKRYEISNYSLNGFECAHNVGYWKRENYLGLGLNSSSMVNNVRWKNTADLKTYIANPIGSVEDRHELSYKEQMEEYMFLGLRLANGVNRTEFLNYFHQDIIMAYGQKLEELSLKGLINFEEDKVSLTDKGIDLSNQVLSEFLLD